MCPRRWRCRSEVLSVLVVALAVVALAAVLVESAALLSD